MNRISAIDEMPAELAGLANQPRVLVRREGAPRKVGRCVVYWMQRAMRIEGNPALDVAIEAANLLGLPVDVLIRIKLLRDGSAAHGAH